MLQNHVVAAHAVFNKVAVFEELIQREPHNAMYYEEVQRVQKNQHIHVAIKLQHILETHDKFRRAAGLPQLDIPKHLWGMRDMRSAHAREQDFMAITAKVEVLCQQLKGRGMYTIPSVTLTTSSSKTGGSVHFQPIDPAQKSSVQAMDQSLLNLSLNLLDDSPRSQSSSSNGPIPHGQAMPRVPAHKGNYPVPPTPYINQTAVDQHMRAQPTPIPPRTSLSPMNVQSPKHVPQLPDSVQPQRLPFVDVPPAPVKNYHADNTSSPSMHEAMSKSLNKRGVKQSSSESSSASTSTGESGPICWNCQEVGHRRHNCKNPSYCSKCIQSGHLPVKCPLKGKRNEKSQTQQKGQQMAVDPMFSNISNKCIRCGGDHAPGSCPTKTHPQVTQNKAGYQMDDNGTVAGKANTNDLPSFISKNGQPTAANMTPSSPRNLAGAQRCPSCAREPITPQVSPNTSQQNFYNVPPVHPPNHFPPPPYFPIPFPPPPIAPSNASNAHSAPVSDISAALTLMTNAVTQGNSNTTAITTALERTTTQFADALQQTMGVRWESTRRHRRTRMQEWTSNLRRSKFLMVLNHLNVTHGWRRCMPCVFKQEGLSARCCYYVQDKLFVTSSWTCPRKQQTTKSRMT